MVGVAALGLGVLKVGMEYAYRSSAPLDASLVFIVGGVLLLQRYRQSRAERDDVAPNELTREVRPIPGELRHLPQVKSTVRYGLAVVAAVVVALPWILAGSDTTLLTIYFIYAIIGLSLLVLTGWAGQISLGQFGFAAIGGWAAAVSGLPMPFALALGGAAGAVAAVLVGLPGLKLRGLHLAISTLAFAVSAKVLFVDDRFLGRMLPHTIERPSVLGMDFDDQRVFYYFIVLVVGAVAVAVAGLRRSRTGRALIALRANEATAQSFGINVLRVRLTAFAVSGFLAAFAGGLFVFHQRQLTPASFGADQSLQMFLFSVIGGLGGIAGPFFGFGYMAVLSFLDGNALIRYAGAGTGAMLLLFAAPGGLSQLFYDSRDAALRRLAVRLRIPVPSLTGDRAAARALDRAQLDLDRARSKPGLAPLRYKLPHQWALDRHGVAGD
jgi:branched-chain amino acid transport system permease protein